MSTIKNRQQPSIPSVPASASAEMRQFLNALRTSVQTLQGDGNTNAKLDRAVTLRELQTNEVKINPKSVLSSLSNIGKGGGSTVSGDVDIFGITVQQPTKPTGARVDVALTTAIVSWDPPRYPGHSYTEIFRQKTNLNSNGDPVDPPQFNEATMIHGTSSSSVFIETIDPEAGYYYWIRHVNIKNAKSPLNATEGVFGKNDLKLDGGLIKPNSINGELIAPGAINTDQLAPASIDGSKIKAGTIEGGNIKAGAIATYHILANAIDGTKIRAGSIDSDKIAAGTISSNHIRSGAIIGDHIAAGTITGGKIAANTIDGGKIVAGTSIHAPVIEGGLITGNVISGSTIEGTAINGTTIKGGRIEGTYITGAYGDFTGSFVVRPVTGTPVASYRAYIFNGKPGSNTRILVGRAFLKDGECYSCSGHSGCSFVRCPIYSETWGFKFSIKIPPMPKETILRLQGFHAFGLKDTLYPGPGITLRIDKATPYNEIALGESGSVVIRPDTEYTIDMYMQYDDIIDREGHNKLAGFNGSYDGGTNKWPTTSVRIEKLARGFDEGRGDFAYAILNRYSRF